MDLGMPYFRSFALVGAVLLGLTSASATDLGTYPVVKLHRGLNNPDLRFAESSLWVLIGHRENFNAP